MKVGIVDLDTSHPDAWVPIIRSLGHDVVGVWDGGAIHPRGFAEAFAQKQQIPRVYESLDEMIDQVDIATIHGCDWDTHVDKARPFLEAGKAVLIDKPVAGNHDDLAWFERWAQQGARVAGGSALRYCVELADLRSGWEEAGATPHTAFCGCGVDDFNYGIHAYSLLAGVLGADAVSVQHIGGRTQGRVLVRWDDGRLGVLVVGATPKWLPFHASIVTDQGVHQFISDPAQLYRAFLGAVMPFLSGETDQPPCPPDSWLAPERWALAAQASCRDGGRVVDLDDIGMDAPAHDGRAFAHSYRTLRYPAGH